MATEHSSTKVPASLITVVLVEFSRHPLRTACLCHLHIQSLLCDKYAYIHTSTKFLLTIVGRVVTVTFT